jgi:putative membrane protein
MKIRFSISFCFIFISAIILTGCNSNSPIKQAEAMSTSGSDSSAAVKVNNDDAQFAIATTSGGMMEIELGKLCATQAKNAQVKSFGAMMVEDHTNADNELKAIAGNKNLILPAAMNANDQQMYNDMKKKTGSDFDRAYINMMVTGHEKVMNDFKKEATGGKDADISSFATKTLPVIQKHLDAAKAAQKVV